MKKIKYKIKPIVEKETRGLCEVLCYNNLFALTLKVSSELVKDKKFFFKWLNDYFKHQMAIAYYGNLLTVKDECGRYINTPEI